jgi:hypothetical protein
MATEELKLCQLQVNVGTGAWRTVMDFEVLDESTVLGHANILFRFGHTHSAKGIRLRIMKPGDTRPLMFWSYIEGWQAWDKVPA